MDAGLGSGVTDDTDGLARAFACAGISLRALATHRETAEVPNAAIAFDALKALEIHTDFAAKVTFDYVLAVLNRMNDLRELLFAQILGPNGRIDMGLGQDVFRVAGSDAVNVAQRDVDALVRGDFYADDTCHVSLNR